MNIKLSSKDKVKVGDSEDIYPIMQRILMRDNKIDREKEHFWIIGLNAGNYICYIELISLGTARKTLVEPMHIFRVAIMKGALKVIAVHNHPSNTMKPSAQDIDITDRLIQVGKILNIELVDHLIISTTRYYSFLDQGVMEKLMESTKYVPTYQLIERIQKEEKEIRKQMQNEIKEKNQQIREKSRELKEKEKQRNNAILLMVEKNIGVEQIAVIFEISVEEVEKISKKKRTNK